MNWTLEVVVVPVSDVDRAKAFYVDRLGFTLDHDAVMSTNCESCSSRPPGPGVPS